MRNLLDWVPRSPADTPPNGDFARYVEELVARQAKSLNAGQQMTQLPRGPQTAASAKRATQQPNQQPTRAQVRAEELAKPPMRTPVGTPADKSKTAAQTVAFDSWESVKESLDNATGGKLSEWGFKFPPLLIFLAVIVAVGLFSVGGFNWGGPILLLFWLFVLPRVLRAVFGSLFGKKSD